MPESVPFVTPHSRAPVLAYHGCDREIGQALLSGEFGDMKVSNNTYDWLGSGRYFFEQDAERARHFVTTCASHPEKKYTQGNVKEPFVVGAVIDLGNCLDLSSQSGIIELAQAYQIMFESFSAKKRSLPINEAGHADDQDLIRRKLDRALLNYLHQLRHEAGLPAYDTVRSPFPQGAPIASNSAFRRFSHIQIAVRNPACIKGFFLPR